MMSVGLNGSGRSACSGLDEVRALDAPGRGAILPDICSSGRLSGAGTPGTGGTPRLWEASRRADSAISPADGRIRMVERSRSRLPDRSRRRLGAHLAFG